MARRDRNHVSDERTRKLSARQYAKGRLYEWGNVIRKVVLRDAPNPNIYNEQPFFNPRINFDGDRIEAALATSIRFERALQVDEVLLPLRDTHSYTAIVIRYVMREPGHTNRKLRHDDQLELWHRRTTMGRTAYYQHLARVEAYVAMALS